MGLIFDAGILPIPAQTWNSKSSSGNANNTGPISTAIISGVEKNPKVSEEGGTRAPGHMTQTGRWKLIHLGIN